jgi:hypothetical protein
LKSAKVDPEPRNFYRTRSPTASSMTYKKKNSVQLNFSAAC